MKQPKDESLTYRLEKLESSFKDNETIAHFLLSFLNPETTKPVLREAALLGLYHYLTISNVTDEIQKCSKKDPSPTIREMANKILEYLKDDF